MTANFTELDKVVTLAEQMEADEGPIVLINLFTIADDEREALVKAWAHDAEFMKQQHGYISTQLHEGLAGSCTYINYAIWQDAKSFRAAFTQPEFQKRIAAYPPSAVASPHLFKKTPVDGLCTA